MEQRIIDILKQNGLSVTESRKKVLSLFLTSKGALEHSSIEKGAGNLDRVTIYRTLHSFTQKGLIHTIPSVDNTIKYALCKNCSHGHHHDDHVHFICEKCGITTCLEEVIIPEVSLPPRYSVRETEVIVKGECASCSV